MRTVATTPDGSAPWGGRVLHVRRRAPPAGEVIDARAQGLVAADCRATEIGEVIAGTHPGRTNAVQRTVYRSLGIASQDLAAADFIAKRAAEHNRGVEVAWH
jgi:alanine dehydrogenase